MNILITGASGFIGGRLASALSKNSDYRIAATGRSKDLVDRFSGMPIKPVIGDLTDPMFVNSATDSVDVIVHCAGLAGTWGDYDDYYQANVRATELLIESAKRNRVQRFINISSPSIYLDFSDQLNIKEDFLPSEFSNHYARTKYEAEVLVAKANAMTFRTVSLRPRMVIGAGDNNVFPRLLKLQQAGLLKQIGDGDNLVSMTSIENLIDLIEACFDAPYSAMGRAYNVSNAQPEKLWDVIDRVCDLMEIPTKRPQLPYRPIMFLAKLNEKLKRLMGVKTEPKLLPVPVSIMANSMTLDIEEARLRLAYQPNYTAEHSIKEFVSWWKQGAPKI